jgi:hypothetical protein
VKSLSARGRLQLWNENWKGAWAASAGKAAEACRVKRIHLLYTAGTAIIGYFRCQKRNSGQDRSAETVYQQAEHSARS